MNQEQKMTFNFSKSIALKIPLVKQGRTITRASNSLERTIDSLKARYIESDSPEIPVVYYLDVTLNDLWSRGMELFRNDYDSVMKRGKLAEACYSGNVTIDISMDSKNISLIATDNGFGIDQYTLCRLFHDIITTEKNKDASLYGGGGAGLFKLSEWASKLGGSITGQNRIDTRGAIFRLMLPSYPINPKEFITTPKSELTDLHSYREYFIREAIERLKGLNTAIGEESTDEGLRDLQANYISGWLSLANKMDFLMGDYPLLLFQVALYEREYHEIYTDS